MPLWMSVLLKLYIVCNIYFLGWHLLNLLILEEDSFLFQISERGYLKLYEVLLFVLFLPSTLVFCVIWGLFYSFRSTVHPFKAIFSQRIYFKRRKK